MKWHIFEDCEGLRLSAGCSSVAARTSVVLFSDSQYDTHNQGSDLRYRNKTIQNIGDSSQVP